MSRHQPSALSRRRCVAALAASSASAHITLQNREATVGSSYKAVFVVPHGCAGSATIKIRVQIPEGVIGVKPMPKAGLESSKPIKGKYASRVRFPRRQDCPRASRKWCGAAASCRTTFYDEFVISTFLTGGLKPNTMLYFPVVQECEQGVSRWIDIPADGPPMPMTASGRRPASS